MLPYGAHRWVFPYATLLRRVKTVRVVLLIVGDANWKRVFAGHARRRTQNHEVRHVRPAIVPAPRRTRCHPILFRLGHRSLGNASRRRHRPPPAKADELLPHLRQVALYNDDQTLVVRGQSAYPAAQPLALHHLLRAFAYRLSGCLARQDARRKCAVWNDDAGAAAHHNGLTQCDINEHEIRIRKLAARSTSVAIKELRH
mmetsp:Transcript_53825/g.149691  ORF Transcript_53825/g.149691 Transcript_53825/m.149691 type:complete len:200 (+) Transcript_53825:779-1378(+)